jgi:hypothetical protein
MTTTLLQDNGGGPLGRRCQRFGSVHYQRNKTLMADPLTGADGDPAAPTINVKSVDSGPRGRCWS